MGYSMVLQLENCGFKEIPSRIDYLRHLTHLYIEGIGIKELPSSIGYLEYLRRLCVSDCPDFEKFPEIQGNMKCLQHLVLRKTAVKELPNSVWCLEALETLSLDSCLNFEKFPEIQGNMRSLRTLLLDETAIRSLPNSICGLKSLEELDLNCCSNLVAFPEIMEDMEHLRRLGLDNTPITELPSSIERLKSLNYLELNNCENLVALPNSIGNLTHLRGLSVRDCSKLQSLLGNLRSLQCCLKILDLAGCNLKEGAIPSDLWYLSSLEYLDVSGNHIRCIPTDIIQLSKLRRLKMNYCQMLEEIPELPSSLEILQAHGCPRLGTLSTPSIPLWSSLLNLFKSRIEDSVYKTDADPFGYHRGPSVVISGGGGIPEWISHQSMGSQAIIELPKNWYEDNNFLGFALFFHHALVYRNECQNDCYGISRCELRISHDDQSKWVGEIDLLLPSKRCRILALWDELICGTSDPALGPALGVTYFPRFAIPSGHPYGQWKNFEAHIIIPYRTPFHGGDNKSVYKVKSCGIHPIYAQDDHQQNQNHWPGLLRENTSFNVKRSHDDTLRIHVRKDQDIPCNFQASLSTKQETYNEGPSGCWWPNTDGSESEREGPSGCWWPRINGSESESGSGSSDTDGSESESGSEFSNTDGSESENSDRYSNKSSIFRQEIHDGGPSGSRCSNIDDSESENSDYYSADEGEPTV